MFQEPEQLRAIGYCRTASVSQASNKKFSVQEEKIGRYMTWEDLEFVKCFYEEGQPGKALMEAYDFCEVQGDITYLVVSDLSRLSRDRKVAQAWVDKFLELGIEVLEVRGYNYTINLVPDLPEKSEGR